MTFMVRGETDAIIQAICDALMIYGTHHSRAKFELYRQNPASIRVRIIDPDFAGRNRAERHDEVWHYLENLPDEVQSEISILLLLAPEELQGSYANVEFEHPIPS